MLKLPSRLYAGYPVIAFVSGSVKLAPDGSFVAARTVSGSSMRVRGRLVGAKLTGGRVELSVGTCVGNIGFQVKHS